MADILEKMSIYIEPDMLIVGNQASANFAAPVFPEYSFNWVIEELDQFDKRSGDSFQVSEETKARLRVLQDYWQGKTHQDEVLANLPHINRLAEKQGYCTAAASVCLAMVTSFLTMTSCWKWATAVCVISRNSTWRKIPT
jgi:pyruvate-formate lyase